MEPEEWSMGKDMFAKWEGADDGMLSNVGSGKYFPMGPSCMVDGQEIRYSPSWDTLHLLELFWTTQKFSLWHQKKFRFSVLKSWHSNMSVLQIK